MGLFRVTAFDEEKKHMEVLGINEFPFSEEFLKTRYREKAFQFHPDVTTDNTEKEMKKVNAAYSYLKGTAIPSYESSEPKKPFIKKDMFDLSEPCELCDGKGYHVRNLPISEPCPDCPTLETRGVFFFFFPRTKSRGFHWGVCPSCINGKKRNGKDCIRCNGTGKVKLVCKTCNGKGYIVNKERTVKETCVKCGGGGRIEVKPFNPVIPKGAILGSR